MRRHEMKRIVLLFAALLAFAGMAFAAVNINSATKEQLESLNGIGPVKAQAIVDYRAKNGPFKSLDDVKKVNGVGDATFDKIKGDISLSGTTVPVKAESKTEKKVDAAADKTKEKASEMKADTKAAGATTEKKASDATATVKEKATDASA